MHRPGGTPSPVPGKTSFGHEEFIEKLPQEEIARLLKHLLVEFSQLVNLCIKSASACQILVSAVAARFWSAAS